VENRLLFTGGDDPGASVDAVEESRENLYGGIFDHILPLKNKLRVVHNTALCIPWGQ
jgi:hypothetical protein